MSAIRQKFGQSLQNSAMTASRSAGSAVAVNVVTKPDAANHLTVNWVRRLGQTSTDAASREAHSQLASLLDYYNIEKKSKDVEAIDWAYFKDRIHTEGVVDKIHDRYEKFMQSEYSVDSAVGRIGIPSEKIKALDTALQYNFMLYYVHYMEHLNQLETMNNIGDINKMSMAEFISLNKGLDTLEMCEREIGNIAPDSYTEDGHFTRMCTQFNWGSRFNAPFSHSQDTVSCVTATLNKMGQ